MSVWNNFASARGNLPEIISKLFHKLPTTENAPPPERMTPQTISVIHY